MVRAQVTLVPTESKKLIAEAVLAYEPVKRALADGMVVIHPSSSTLFIAEKLAGHSLTRNGRVWCCGVIVAQGACVDERSRALRLAYAQAKGTTHVKVTPRPPKDFPHSWAFHKGKLVPETGLGALLEEMGPGDIYIKGANAIDAQGNAAVLYGNQKVAGGTIGRVVAASRRRGFSIVLPIGLEKLIPGTVRDAAAEMRRSEYCYAMGTACGLFPCEGTTITEVDAIRILTGAVAVPVAAGGLGGAGGAMTFIIKGSEARVRQAIGVVEGAKGARLPRIRAPKCDTCAILSCDYPLKEARWNRG